VQTVSLHDYVRDNDIPGPDFIELDTQGTELEILQGAEEQLASSLLGVRVEVEFSPMYRDQPLFADIDTYLRRFGFVLHDLSRHRYRRENFPRDLETRGQLLYGHALYLKDPERLPDAPNWKGAVKVAIVSAFNGFHDYALDVIDRLIVGEFGSCSCEDIQTLNDVRIGYTDWLGETNRSRLRRIALTLEGSRFDWLVDWAGLKARDVLDTHAYIRKRRKFSWSD